MNPLKKESPALPKRVAPEVKGPIRCHKCQLICNDAVAYRGHQCNPHGPFTSNRQTRRLVDDLADMARRLDGGARDGMKSRPD
jgi:hypothetical protein